MALLDDILAWTQTLPTWQQDAARRLFQKPEGLSDGDDAELYVLLKAAHGLPSPEELAAVPLSRDHLPTSLPSGNTITLKAMRDLKHVNCIAPEQLLPFEPKGMTVIYGGNASGKSGYARVMKRACRARDQKEQVLPDANDPAASGRIPEALFDVEVNGSPKVVRWTSKGDPPEELASVAVFDCHSARVYLTGEQEVAYLPYGLDVVEALANTVLPGLERRLGQELASINTDCAQFTHLGGDTKVGQLIAALSHRTDSGEVKALATLSDGELERAEELDRTLGEADPAAKAKQLRLSAERVKELVRRVDASTVCIDGKAIEKLKTIVQESLDADRAEQAAAKLLHSGEALLPGTGESAWKALFEAARKFSVERAYPGKSFPNTERDAVCVLCQQPLQDAADRMKRFEKYIQDDIAKTAAAKRQELATGIEAIRRADLTVGVQGAIAGELDQLDAAIRPTLTAFGDVIEQRRRKVLDAVQSLAWDSVPDITGNPRQALRALAAKQYRRTRDYERASDETTSAVLRKERECLAARKKLSLCLEQVLSLLDRLKKKHALEACRNDLNTRPISLKSRDLASAAVTSALKGALDKEFTTLGMGHIKTKLKDRNVKGRVLHQLLLDVPTGAKVEDVLSEGEQRAIAIGAFLAELELAEHSSAIVFDDPVSSLDHRHRGRVAKRLASESLKRQVIILTHDILFLHQLQTGCSNLGISPGLRFLEKIGKHAGVVQKGLPWDHKSYKERIDCLEKAQKRFEKLPWPAQPDEKLAREMIQQYSFLRSTIERVVQDFVLAGTVKRFDDYIRVKNLKLVVGLEAAEAAELCRLNSRCDGIVEAHDPVSARDAPPPTAEEFGEDIEALKAVIQMIGARRKP
jgi:ABC-type dipeptide/oligopeptide/nickel transport system ATPase subunit